ncbi:methylmalonyl-CoA mutase family protein [Aquabacter spiritensis]|uniref:Heterodimeric methylmalonyl-CoA mutase small subunit n=1 Tax=Aquabacter spiritensis TaxID=933073 RepID=A0A4R3LVT7_9HYPH|nr:methylmalonyl-CoA mutase family protein [Aquabacter spiritensis]TCT04673.1 heterodimeric methylmalonyl-CoA mutase small subunit [Aquabacter spiritensis]
MTDLPFATDLKPATRGDWMKLVEGVLKGAPYDRKLVTRTYEGLVLDPLPPRRAESRILAGRQPGAPWTVSARVDQADLDAANAQALDDLGNGASGLTLVFASSPHAHGFGLPDGAVLTRVLDSVMVDLIETRIESGRFQGREDALAFAALIDERGHDPKGLWVSFGLDPIGDMARSGSAPMPWANLAQRFGETCGLLAARGFSSPLARADGAVHHAAGASDAQELAAILATAIAYLRALEATGMALEEAAGRIELALTADVNQIATIAKFRAIRLLWGAAMREAGVKAPPLRVHATTAWRTLTRRDPYMNLLRGTIAAFAAGVGGADSITVLPFTQALGLPDPFARRLARNTQLILLEEANVHRVADPAAGAGAVEAQTEGLAAAAWEVFRAIEAKGGMADAVSLGWWQNEVAQVRARRAKDVATRKEPLTGTSEFPLLDQVPAEVLAPAPAPPPAVMDTAFASHRLSEPFEALRDAAEAAAVPPMVFLATLGPVSAFTARATFAKNFFEAGGLKAPVPEPFARLDDLIDAFVASGTTFACLCASDDLYAAEGVVAADALKTAGAHTIWLAGRPGELEGPLTAAGVSGFIHAGGDVLAALRIAHAALGL